MTPAPKHTPTIENRVERLFQPGTFRLHYRRPFMGHYWRSGSVKANNIVEAVTKVLGGCDAIDGDHYQVGTMQGYVERIK